MLGAIVVIAENGAIGKNGQLLCHLPADLKHFKSVTMGYPIIMGRKTFESLPKGALPGRLNVVVTRNADFTAPGVVVCHSVEEALAATEDAPKRYIIGGAQLYAATIGLVDELHLTQLHATFPDADTFFPPINPQEWQELSRDSHPADDRNPYPYTFTLLVRSLSQLGVRSEE